MSARLAHADDPAFDKGLSDNRDRYVSQSAATKNGVVAELPARDDDLPEPCLKCDPPGILWTFERGEDPRHPEAGEWNECSCYGTNAQRDREKVA